MVRQMASMVKAERCSWGNGDPLYERYHDLEWGVPCRDATELFELLILEGAQAGLSWITVLKKRRHMREVFHGFDADRLARLTDGAISRLLEDPGIIRHRGKLEAVRGNAKAFLELGSPEEAVDFFWCFVDRAPLINRWDTSSEVPAHTAASTAMSRALKRRGFKFVGPTICYAFMQSAGMVNDHLEGCFRHRECQSPNTIRVTVD
jgi:DNA-3-methyladenine glycosylase I